MQCVIKCTHRNGDKFINIRAERNDRVEMSAGDHPEDVDDQHDGQTEAERDGYVRRWPVRCLHGSHASDEHEQAGSDALRQEHDE